MVFPQGTKARITWVVGPTVGAGLDAQENKAANRSSWQRFAMRLHADDGEATARIRWWLALPGHFGCLHVLPVPSHEK